MTETTALIPLDKISPAELFASDQAIDDLLKRIDETARKELVDSGTKHGRARLTSIAYQVARSKTAIDGMGKDRVAGIKAQQDKLREIVDIRQTAHIDTTSGLVRDCISKLNEITVDESFGDFQDQASDTKAQALDVLTKLLTETEQREAEQAELTKLRAEKAAAEEESRKAREAKEQAEREERIRQEAAEAATRKAEAEKQAEIDRLEREKAEAEAAKRRENEEERRRAADKEHRAKVNSAAAVALVAAGLAEDDARTAIIAIADDFVPHVRIQY